MQFSFWQLYDNFHANFILTTLRQFSFRKICRRNFRVIFIPIALNFLFKNSLTRTHSSFLPKISQNKKSCIQFKVHFLRTPGQIAWTSGPVEFHLFCASWSEVLSLCGARSVHTKKRTRPLSDYWPALIDLKLIWVNKGVDLELKNKNGLEFKFGNFVNKNS
jgi:hypothetical protein